MAFIQALLSGMAVEPAYIAAMDDAPKEARHAWRWLKDLRKQLPTWRTWLAKPAEIFVPSQRSATLTHVLPTVERLLHFAKKGERNTVQCNYQHAFF